MLYCCLTKAKHEKEKFSLRAACDNVSTYNIFRFSCFLVTIHTVKIMLLSFLIHTSSILFATPSPEDQPITEPTENMVTTTSLEHRIPRFIDFRDVQPSNRPDLTSDA